MRKDFTLPSLTFISILIIMTGCEPHCSTSLINKSGHDIGLKIEYNKKTVQDAWGDTPFIPFMRQYGVDSTVILTALDSVNLISTYSIKNNGTFLIDGGIQKKPDYDFFSSFTIVNNQDTIILRKQTDYEQYFIDAGGNSYEWLLK